MKRGLFELAHRGTVFLDEIGDMPIGLQAKLLRVLQERRFRRVGGTRDIEVDVRIIGATNRDLRRRVEEGRFREDLYYRLDVIPIELPPLRDRAGDVPMLVRYFIDAFNERFHKNVRGATPRATDALVRYAWPGNVRELRNLVERAMILGAGPEIDINDLPVDVLGGGVAAPGDGGDGTGGGRPGGGQKARRASGGRLLLLPSDGVSLDEIERDLLIQALLRARGNKTAAARLLGLNRYQVRYRIEKYSLRREEYLPEGEPEPIFAAAVAAGGGGRSR
jgi:transcriptional regulator with PAS, ATPase and Fis domain